MSLTLYRSSRGLDPATLEPGRDLVLEPSLEHGLSLAEGVAIEDHLPISERERVDAAAMAALADWRARRGDDLVTEGVDLGYVAEVELLATCFLPAELVRSGLQAVGATGQIRAVGFEPAALAAVRTLAPTGAQVEGQPGDPAPPPGRGGTRNVWVEAAERTHVAPHVRGQVVCVPYWHLVPVYRRMARRRGGPRPVPLGLRLAGVGTADTVRVLARGGWGGSSGRAARNRASTRVGALVGELAAGALGRDDRERALDRWALSVAAGIAGAAPAQMKHFSRVVRDARLIVLPFDSPNEQRVLVAAGRRHGVPSLVVQHGFRGLLNDPDMTVSDHVAVWSTDDRDELAGAARGTVTVTGNPAATRVAGTRAPQGPTARTAVLVEYASRTSARVGLRLGLQHVGAALRALAVARPGTQAVVRPHPSDDRQHLYRAALAGPGAGLDVLVDAATPIEDLLRDCDLCVGALSTATLQAIRLGVPTIFLDLGGISRPWPFDGTLPRARSSDELAGLIAAGLGAPAAEAAAEALGAIERPETTVLDMIDTIAGR